MWVQCLNDFQQDKSSVIGSVLGYNDMISVVNVVMGDPATYLYLRLTKNNLRLPGPDCSKPDHTEVLQRVNPGLVLLVELCRTTEPWDNWGSTIVKNIFSKQRFYIFVSFPSFYHFTPQVVLATENGLGFFGTNE